MLSNLSANHCDTGITINRGLSADKDDKGGLALRGKSDTSLMESIDSKQMGKNLCISQKFHEWNHFLTFTCNQKNHFGVAPIKNWIDFGWWKDGYINFTDLDELSKQR